MWLNKLFKEVDALTDEAGRLSLNIYNFVRNLEVGKATKEYSQTAENLVNCVQKLKVKIEELKKKVGRKWKLKAQKSKS